MAMILAFTVATERRLCAQTPPAGGAPGQSQPAVRQQNSAPPAQPSPAKPQSDANPFPEDTDSVPVMPSRNSPDVPAEAGEEPAGVLIPMPAEDVDPARSPEDAAAAAEASDSSSSSSLAGLGNLDPPDVDTPQSGKHKRKEEQVVPEHHETAAEDESVGSYYLDNKDWKGALSRFQSALVLDPDNPDVYWGLAECERHMGDFADARTNYQKVMRYDPGSRHAKEAGKALQDPEIANAKPDARNAAPSQ